VYDTYLFLR
jgi:hypothetical protein